MMVYSVSTEKLGRLIEKNVKKKKPLLIRQNGPLQKGLTLWLIAERTKIRI